VAHEPGARRWCPREADYCPAGSARVFISPRVGLFPARGGAELIGRGSAAGDLVRPPSPFHAPRPPRDAKEIQATVGAKVLGGPARAWGRRIRMPARRVWPRQPMPLLNEPGEPSMRDRMARRTTPYWLPRAARSSGRPPEIDGEGRGEISALGPGPPHRAVGPRRAQGLQNGRLHGNVGREGGRQEARVLYMIRIHTTDEEGEAHGDAIPASASRVRAPRARTIWPVTRLGTRTASIAEGRVQEAHAFARGGACASGA